MQGPRMRLTIGGVMTGIAILALLLAAGTWAVQWISQPIPLPHSAPYRPRAPAPAIGPASGADAPNPDPARSG